MGIVSDAIAGIRELMFMQDRIKTMQETNTKLASMINYVDRRLLRVETYLELNSGDTDQPFRPIPLEYKP